jgi:hypothetical protein
MSAAKHERKEAVVRIQLAWTIACLAVAATGRAQAPDRDPQTRFSNDADEPAQDASSYALQPAPSQAEIDAALARYAREPSAEQVVHEALRVAPTPRAAAILSRARAAGWIPRLGLRARRGQTVDLSAAQTLDAEALRVRSNDDLTLEATLSFDLERVVFRREEIALLRQSEAERLVRGRIVREVIQLYFERRRLQLERDLRRDPGLARSVRIAEIEALLDAFTNGAFRRMIARSRWTTGASIPASASPSTPRSR